MEATRNKILTFAAAALVALQILLNPQPSSAVSIFEGSGTNPETGGGGVSGQAQFTLVGSTLTLVLTSTTTANHAKGDDLTGIAFNIATNPTLSYSESTGIALTSGHSIFTNSTTVNNATVLGGSWTNNLGATPLGNYGVAATGFNGAFSAAGITTGTGGPDYGIVGPNVTFTGGGFSGSAFPLAKSSLTFTFSVIGGSMTESDIQNVKFLFGTAGNGIVDGTCTNCTTPPPLLHSPEPSTVFLLGSGLAGLAAWRWRRRQKRAARPD